MKFRRRSNKQETISEINMTSLIDVSLVLVVVLLVATPLAFQSSILVRSTVAAGQQAEVDTKSERVEVEILNPEELIVNRIPTSRDDFAETLRPLLAASTTRAVIVRCGNDVPHGAFVSVIDEAKQCGASGIAILGN